MHQPQDRPCNLGAVSLKDSILLFRADVTLLSLLLRAYLFSSNLLFRDL